MTILVHQTLSDPASHKSLKKWFETTQTKGVVPSFRTSDVGKCFVKWCHGEKIDLYPTQIKYFPHSWSGAYVLFKTKKVDWMLGFTSSQLAMGQDVSAVMFEEGLPLVMWGVSVLKKERPHPIRGKFLEFLYSQTLHAKLLKTCFVFPASKTILSRQEQALHPLNSLTLDKESLKK